MLRIAQPPFLTIQGEGPQAGTPSVFLRLSGCHIHCPWCIGIKAGRNIPKIWTRGKNIPINEIKPGDKVLAVNENNEITETIVKKVFSREVSEWYEIKIEGKPLMFVTPEHPFLTKDGWVMVKDLKVGDEVLFIDFRTKLSYKIKVNNPMKRQECVRKMLAKMDYKKLSEKMKQIAPTKRAEVRRKLSEAQKSPELRKLHSERMKKDNPMKRKEIRKKVSEKLKGRHRYFTEEHKKKISIGKKLNPTSLPGRKNPSYVDGRTLIYQSKKGVCKLCGKEGKTHFHHITYNPPELIEVCVKCHKKIHQGFYPELLKEKCLYIDNRLRQKIFEKYNTRCVICGSKNDLVIRHINFNVYDNREDNLVLLCRKCNSGLNAGQRKQWVTKFNERLKQFSVMNGLKVLEIKHIKDKLCYFYNSGKSEKKIQKLKVYNFECTPYKNYIVNGIISHNCDTKMSWGKGTLVDIPELVELVKKEIYYSTPPGIINWLTVTGGEPMLQQKGLGKFIRRVVDETGLRVAIETSGSVPASIEWQSLNWDFIHWYQISPKKRGGIDALVTYPDAISVLKFVLVEENSLLNLIEEVLERTNFKREQIWILPLSSSLKELTINSERARKFCLKYGFKLSPRLQYFWKE